MPFVWQLDRILHLRHRSTVPDHHHCRDQRVRQTLSESHPDRRLLHFVFGKNRDGEEAEAAAAAKEASISALTKRELKDKARAMSIPLRSGPMKKSDLIDAVMGCMRAGAARGMLTVPGDVFAHIVPYLES